MRVLIIGCGYVGLELGRRLAASGAEVVGARRGADPDRVLEAAGGCAVRADITRPADLASLPGRFDAVVSAVSSGGGGLEAYREVYVGGARNLVSWALDRRVGRLVWISSTSVYGQTDGSWVTEESVTDPVEPTARCLVEAETVVAEAHRLAGLPTQVARVAGIYGPGRGHLFGQLVAGTARLEADDGRWINMIHRDDVASAIEAILLRGESGRVYDAVDDAPVQQGEFLRFLANETGLRMPGLAAGPGPTRRRGLTNKRVSNRRLRDELGWKPMFPTYREGYAEVIEAFVSGGRTGGGTAPSECSRQDRPPEVRSGLEGRFAPRSAP